MGIDFSYLIEIFFLYSFLWCVYVAAVCCKVAKYDDVVVGKGVGVMEPKVNCVAPPPNTTGAKRSGER